jgi:6-phosphogluconolactonase
MYACVGSRTTRERHARGEGISVYRVDAATGVLDRVQLVGDLVNPLCLACGSPVCMVFLPGSHA